MIKAIKAHPKQFHQLGGPIIHRLRGCACPPTAATEADICPMEAVLARPPNSPELGVDGERNRTNKNNMNDGLQPTSDGLQRIKQQTTSDAPWANILLQHFLKNSCMINMSNSVGHERFKISENSNQCHKFDHRLCCRFNSLIPLISRETET